MPEIEDLDSFDLDFGDEAIDSDVLVSDETTDIDDSAFDLWATEKFEEDVPPTPRISVGEIADADEAEFAIANPNIYAAGKAFQHTVKSIGSVGKYFPHDLSQEGVEAKARAGKTVLTHAPFTKRVITPEARAEFMQLDQQHQTRALLWDTLETLSFMPTAWRAGWAGMKGLFSPVTKALKASRLKPLEDVAMKAYGAEKFTHAIAGRRMLKKMGLVDEEEIYAILNDELPSFLGRRIAVEKKAISPAMREMIEYHEHAPRITNKLANALAPDTLRATHYRSQWQRYGSKIFGKDWTPNLEKKVYKAHLARLSPDVKNIQLRDASARLMQAIQKDMFRHPKVAGKLHKNAISAYNKMWIDDVSPTRVVFGTWQASHGAYDSVYKVVRGGLGSANSYALEKQLTLGKMWEQYGLGAVKVGKGGRVRFTPAFSKDQSKRAYEALAKLDDMAQRGRKDLIYRQRQMPQEAQAVLSELSATERRIVQGWRDFSDSLYGEYALEKIPQLYEQYNLTPDGILGVQALMARIAPKIGHTMSTDSGLTHEQKYVAIQEALRIAREGLEHPWLKSMGRHPWFDEAGEGLTRTLSELTRDFTMTDNKGGRFIGYLENYIARVGGRHRKIRDTWDKALVPMRGETPVGTMRGFFTKARTNADTFDPVNGFDSMIRGRIRAQSNDLFLYPKINRAVQHLQSVNAPTKLKKYADHYLSRVLGRASATDVNIANWVSRSGIENLPRVLGGGPWDERRVMGLAQMITDLNLQAGLGFKPFSLIRNMFQPLLLVPADLGGLKSVGHLAKGMARQLDSKFRSYVREIGAVGEFVPELARTERMLPWGVGARMDRMRDGALWMYKLSDRWNRYVTAGAAFEKWNAAVKAVGETNISTMPNRFMKQFARKSGLKGRYPWIKNDITEMLRKGDLNNARDAFIRDVVADTQFLYDIAESPILAQRAGVITKTAALFQSWWMNYGTLMEKWMRTGDSGTAKANRLFTFMLSTAAAEQMLTPMFGSATAKRTVGLGVFPTEVNEFLLPPAWGPIYHGVRTVVAASQGDIDQVERQVKAAGKSLNMFVPGGLQMQTFVNAAQTGDGWEGLAPAIFRFHQDPDYSPLWGMTE